MDNLRELGNTEFFSGCRNKVPSKSVLHKIPSESRRIGGLGSEEIAGLLSIAENQKKVNILLPGIIRYFSVLLPSLVRFSEDSSKIYHYTKQRDIIYFDTTGSIIRNTSSF